jgi:peptide/nickel transport system substrate-binding protein
MISFLKKIYLNLTSKEKKYLLVFTIFLLTSLFILSFIFLKKSTIEVPKTGGEIKIGIAGQPVNINPVLAKNNADKTLVTLLFTPLSNLADKIEPIEDSNLWRVRLKENIFWSDGKKITSDDIIFTILKIKEAKDDSPLYSFWKNIEVNRISELEVQFDLREKYSFFEEILNNFYFVPKHIFADLPVLNWHLSEYNLNPISNGSYKFDSISIEKNGFISGLLLKTNDYYLNQKPYIPQINIKFYPNEENLLKAFNTGGIDIFVLKDFKKISNLKRPYNLKTFLVSNYYAVFINQSQNLALKENAVRKAMSISINRDELINKIFNGYAISAFNPLPWFNENLKENTDINLASKILDDAGWKFNDSGIREKQIKNNTIQLNFKLTVPDIDFLVQTANFLKESWSKIGIKTDIIKVDPKKIILENIENRAYELILFGNAIYPKFNLYPFWHSAFIFSPGLNLSLYSNSSTDKLLLDLYQKPNINQNETISKILENINNDHSAIFLYGLKYLLISPKNIYGINEFLINDQEDIFINIKDWYLKTKRIFK